MEKKKLLLIAVSLGVFLVIVVGLSILIFAPRKRETVTAGTATARVDPVFDNSRTRNDPVTIETPDDDSDTALASASGSTSPSTAQGHLYVYDGNQKTPDTASTVIEIAPPSKTAVPDTAPGGRAAQSSTTTSTPKTSSAVSTPAATVYRSSSATQTASTTIASKDPPAPAAPSIPRSTSAAATAPSTPAKSTSVTVTTPSTPAKSTSTVATAQPVSRQPVSAVRPSQKLYNNYWVQAGSFSTQIRAEDVKETLQTKGLTSVIETSAVNGKNLFRVRIGPYTSQNEADYWLAIVKSIDGFQDSLVWQN